jgi:hypothetical protein
LAVFRSVVPAREHELRVAFGPAPSLEVVQGLLKQLKTTPPPNEVLGRTIQTDIVPALEVRKRVCEEASKDRSGLFQRGATQPPYLALEHLLHKHGTSSTYVKPQIIRELLKGLSRHPQPDHLPGTVVGYAYGLKHVLDKVPESRRILVTACREDDPRIAFPALLLSTEVFGPEHEALLEAGFYPAVVAALSHSSPFCRMAAALAAYVIIYASREPVSPF